MTCSRTGRRPPRSLRVAIDSLAFGGDGVGRAPDGRVVFVPGGAPGDELEVTIDEEKKGFVRATLARVLRPSPARIDPPCVLFRDRECGGCQWQHVAIEAQRAAKEEIVRRALRHVAIEQGIAPLATPSPPLGWRRRARLRWRRVASDTPAVIGYAERRSHRLVDVPTCPQLEASLDRALRALRDALAPRLVGSGEVHLLVSRAGDIHVVLDGTGARALGEVAARLIGVEGIAGVVLRDPSGADVIGAAAIDLGDESAPFLASADLFAQASAGGNDLLRQLVRQGVGDLDGGRVLELHAGSGNFTRDLMANTSIVAVEESPTAAALARHNLSTRSTSRDATFLPDAAASAVDAAIARGERFDALVVDPPRTGLEPALCDGIRALGPSRIVYVSCDPNTLARDLLRLAASGAYEVEAAFPLDLMPQTFHTEVVAYLRRKA